MSDRRCLNCGDPLPPERTRRAKFCNRDCQVEHLRRVGPTEPGSRTTAAGPTVTLRLSDDDRARLSAIAEQTVVSARRAAEIVLSAALERLAPGVASDRSGATGPGPT